MSSKDGKSTRNRGIYLLPNLFTVSALFAGLYGIVSAMQGAFDHAAVAIYVAMIMDSLDGRVARLTNTQTMFGAELDSLSDMVSFGVAPGLILYTWILQPLGKLGWLATFIYTMAVALRLARFNTQLSKTDNRYFQGLPSPAAAGLMAGVVWFGIEYAMLSASMGIIVAFLSIVIGLLMVSNVRYRSFKDLDLKGKVPFITLLLIVIVLVLVLLNPPEVLFSVFAVYAISGPLMTVMNLRKARSRKGKAKPVKKA